jgi:hypothetical protein
MAAPIHPKVKAASSGALVSAAVVWAIEHYLFKDATPGVLDGALQVLVPAVVAFVSGWLARWAPKPAADNTPEVTT